MSEITAKTKVLYLAYDGMTDPLGQSQVLSYLKVLSTKGFSFDVVSFEKPDVYSKYRDSIQEFIKGFDITWHPMVYHKSPPILSTIYDIESAWTKIKALYKTKMFEIVHCRGYTLTSLGIRAKEKYGSKFLFDMRGWWPDEKKESGLWSSAVYKPVYNYFKKQERLFFAKADHAISLTHVGKREIIALGLQVDSGVSVIPTCVNFDVFKGFDIETRIQKRKEFDIPEDAIVMLYSGSVGANYRTDLVLRFFIELKKKNANSFLVFLSHSDHEIIRKEIETAGVNPADCRIKSVRYHEVSENLMVGDIGLIMYNLGFSVIGRSPTKLGEYWASGLSCLSARKIGDLESIVGKYEQSGVLIESLEEESEYQRGIEEILEMQVDKAKLMEHAIDYFSLSKGCEAYLNVYNNLKL